MDEETDSGCSKKKCLVTIGILVGVILIVAVGLLLPQKPAVEGLDDCYATALPSDKCYATAAVAADAGICSEIGRDMLNRKGSAVDTAIAALLCVSLVNPHSMGIGGGVIFTIYNASTNKVETIDARETAPRNVLINMFVSDTKSVKPGLFIAVPGELRGYEKAHQRHGRLPWKELFEPSIKLACEGFKIGKALAKAIQENEDAILKFTALREVFCRSNKITLKENDVIYFPQLAVTYRMIAEKGADVFYNGSLSQGIVDDINSAGGVITREDLMFYQPEVKEHALNFTVRNYTVHVPNAPSGGPVLALILNILKGYNFSSSSVSTTENKILTYHRIAEAFRAAYAEKTNLGDPRYGHITEFIQNMTSDSFADDKRSKIKDDTTQQPNVLDDKTVPDDFGTSHLSIIAEDGSAVAVTSSINNYFGSKVMSRGTGIIFNDHIQDFSDPQLRHNFLQPGKRPLSSMSPTIILDKDRKQVKMVVGASGGTQITTATAQSVVVGLKLKNHIITNVTTLGNVQAVIQEKNRICAVSDRRKGGYPAGY